MLITRHFLAFVSTLVVVGKNVVFGIEFDCDPCLDRTRYKIQAITHGNYAEPFWQQVEATMNQAAYEMEIDFKTSLYPEDESSLEKGSIEAQMASDIAALQSSDDLDALIVTIPSTAVRQAVSSFISNTNIPVFGFNVGYEVAEELGLLGFVAMDQELAGEAAGEKFAKIFGDGTAISAVYVNAEQGSNQVFDTRFLGFQQALSTRGASFTQVSTIQEAFQGCLYNAVLLSDPVAFLDQAIAQFASNGCAGKVHIGTFGNSEDVYFAINTGKISFSVSSQPHLQAALPVLMASLYATTGKRLAPSSESKYGMISTGPHVIDVKNQPGDTLVSCEQQAFPVCGSPLSEFHPTDEENSCGCIDRSTITIAGVLHGVTTDIFWDGPFAAAAQAARDFGIELKMPRLEPEHDQAIIHNKMSERIKTFCSESVDAIFVSIPDASIVEAIEHCQKLNIPVLSVNAGGEASQELGLIAHIGMVEFNAGYLAGKRMIETGKMTQAMCLMHEQHIVLFNRCGGFKQAIDELGGDTINYIGDFDVPLDNEDLYRSIVEDALKDQDPSWAGIGILLLGPVQAKAALPLRKSHPEVLMGAFDTSEYHYDGLDSGDLLFGMDQGPYLQGYMPIAILTWIAYSKQRLIQHLVETGPDFILSSPTPDQQQCEATHFGVCRPPDEEELPPTTIAEDRKIGAIVAVSVIAFALIWIIVFLLYRMKKLTEYVESLKKQGKDVPSLPLSAKLSAAYKPVDAIVSQHSEAEVI